LAKYFSKEWWDSRSPAQKAVFNIAALVPAARVGKGLWTVSMGIRGVRPAARAVSVVKRPLHELVVMTHSSNPLAVRWTSAATRALVIRKRLGLAAIGYSAINPFESFYYFHQRDWTRLGINLRFPFVGIHLYNLYLHLSEGGSGPPSGVSPTGPTRSGGPVVQLHRRQEKPV
jgi:hypothetical protein